MNTITFNPHISFQANKAEKTVSQPLSPEVYREQNPYCGTCLRNNFIACLQVGFKGITHAEREENIIREVAEQKLIDEAIKIFEDPEKSVRFFAQVVNGKYENKHWKKLGDNILHKPYFAMSLMGACLDKVEESGNLIPKEFRVSIDYIKEFNNRLDIEKIRKSRKETNKLNNEISLERIRPNVLAALGSGGLTAGVITSGMSPAAIDNPLSYASLALLVLSGYMLYEAEDQYQPVADKKDLRDEKSGLLEIKSRAVESGLRMKQGMPVPAVNECDKETRLQKIENWIASKLGFDNSDDDLPQI